MFCNYCGKEIADNSVFCVHCGNPVAVNGGANDANQPATLQPVPYEPTPVANPFQQPYGGCSDPAYAPVQPAYDPYASPAVPGGAQVYAPAGAQVYTPGMTNQQPAPKKSKAVPIIIGVVAVAVVAAIAVFVALPHFGQSGEPSVDVNPIAQSSSSSSTGSNSSASNSASSSTSSSSSSSATSPKGSTVEITVKTSSGETLKGTVRRDANGYVIADSSTKTYSVSELKAKGLSDAELCIAWNEPFARLGYHFKNPGLRAYFESCSWYKDTNYSGGLGSDNAAATNNARLREIAQGSSSASKWMNLASS